jgi:two-component system NtrC family sensor kinase
MQTDNETKTTEKTSGAAGGQQPSGWEAINGEGNIEVLARQALLARPGVSIRTRLIIAFLGIFIVATGAVIAAWIMMSQLDGKLELIERADKFANEIQQCRRYEKNYLLYGTSLTNVLEHLSAARRTLVGTKAELGKVVGIEQWDELERDLEAYMGLIFKLADIRRNAGLKKPAREPEIEGRLRRHGARMVDIAILMSKRERNSVKHRLLVMRQYFMISLLLLLGVIVYMAHSLSRHFLKRLDFLEGVTKRIGKGDFKPIMPIRKYRDEFTNLSVAMNQMMHELNSSREQLVQAGKIAAVGTLTAGIAHEINNPVNNISLIVESLVEGAGKMDEAERQRLLQEAMAQSDRVTEIVKNLLEFSRASHPRLEEASLEELVNKTARLVQNEMHLNQIAFSLDVKDQLPPLHLDKGGLQQVLLNLLLNSIQAMPDGGEIAVTIRLADGMNEGRIDITDTGSGILKKDLDKIFDPFYTTKKDGEGTGLGLSVSHSIIKKHGGRIEVSSTPGEGTTFSVFLPFERPAF